MIQCKRQAPAAFLSGIVALAVLAGCSGGSSDPFGERSALVWTDTGDLALAAEQFNVQSHSGKIRLIPEAMLTAARDFQRADGILGHRMLTASQLRVLTRLEGVLDSLSRTPTDYPENSFELTASGALIGFPLSVDPPVVVFPRTPGTGPWPSEGQSEVDAWLMDLEALRGQARAFTQTSSAGVLQRLGYNPAWDREFIQAFLFSRGADFSNAPETEEGLRWEDEALVAGVRELRNWFADSGISRQQLNQFDENYGYDTWYNSLRFRRIQFRVIPFSEYQALDAEYRDALQFRWLTFGGRVYLSGPAVTAYAVAGRESTGTVVDFISWVSSEAGVDSVLKTRAEAGLTGLLYLNGYPLVSDRESTWQSRYFPDIVFPPNHLLAFSRRLPSAWDRLLDEVILPWVRQVIATPADQRVSTSELAQRLRSWQLLYRQD